MHFKQRVLGSGLDARISWSFSVHTSMGASFACVFGLSMGFPATQTVKNLPAMQKTSVQSLCWEDPLEKGMATRSGILAWRIPWTEEPGRLHSMGLQRVRHD